MAPDSQVQSTAAVGADALALGAHAVDELVDRTLREIATGLDCPRFIVLSYSHSDGLLRAVRGFGVDVSDLSHMGLTLSEFPAAEQALRTRQIRTLSSTGAGLPAPLKAHLSGELVLLPLSMGERWLAVLICQPSPGVSVRSPQWLERAEHLAANAVLVAELVRLSLAYQDERRLRQATQAIIAAILEGRPLSEVAEIIADQVAECLGEERVGLYLVDAQGQYQASALRHVSAEYAEGISRLRRQTPFSARAIATHLPYFTPDAVNDPQVTPALRALLEREKIQSLLLAMLHHGDRIRGALAVYPTGERRFTPREMMLFHALSDQATLAVAIAQQLEQQRDTATLEERNRLAREIHDTVAQSLAGVLMQFEMGETFLNAGDYNAVRELLVSARDQTKKALEDTRRAVQGLAPPSLDQVSLAEALQEETRIFSAESGIATQNVVTGEPQPLSGEQRLAVLRVAQEALNNARKHSRAQRVRVGLQYGAEGVVLIVEDDGAGFDKAARSGPDDTGGYGLFGMEERARLLGGELTIESTPGWGTRIRAALPYRVVRDSQDGRIVQAPPKPLPAAQTVRTQAAVDGALRVLIADDHSIVRKGLRDIFEAQGDIVVAGEAENGNEAVERAKELRPDVVLMDLQMPDVDGLEGMRRMHAELPDIPVIVLTTFENEETVAQALAAGARGYLLKDTEPAALVAALHSVTRGESLFSSSVTQRLATFASERDSRAASDLHLNEREMDVLNLLARGARNKEIAAELFVTVSTVEKHIASLFSKLEVSNRAEAVRAAVGRGLVSMMDDDARPRRAPG